jgi:hypothetical protein
MPGWGQLVPTSLMLAAKPRAETSAVRGRRKIGEIGQSSESCRGRDGRAPRPLRFAPDCGLSQHPTLRQPSPMSTSSPMPRRALRFGTNRAPEVGTGCPHPCLRSFPLGH